MLFRHLKIPLAVIAVDINTQEMIVYDQKNTPDFSVAEAVRQSMSVPLFFEPRRNYVVPDGAITLANV